MGDNFKLVTFSAVPFEVRGAHREMVPYGQALECHPCGQKFHRKFELKRHIDAVHNPDAKKRCPETGCQVELKRDDKRRKHMKDRHPEADCGARTGDSVPGSMLPLPDSSAGPLSPQGSLDTKTRSILQYSLAYLGIVPQSIDNLSIETKFAIEEFLVAQMSNHPDRCFQSRENNPGGRYAGQRYPTEPAASTTSTGPRFRNRIPGHNEHLDAAGSALGWRQEAGGTYHSDAAITMQSDRFDDYVSGWEIEDLFDC
ncbi:hypothetical protein GP486_000414 [Trichoglossum hirsutum]|uniref:C2H2-type domain-containing protein n=1 Tax=Trichoglossum hirsutum TaxID=265104 RepID=A0A9P8LIL5_9PEZI|nr:hypothetical protein GP486_000414 [Trichoglossum hirsutum]